MNIFQKIYWISSNQIGFDPRRLYRSIRGFPRYISNYLEFKNNYDGKLKLLPCLYDWFEEGGDINNEYFWQDLYVARKINNNNPEKHVDIGSRLDGFVSHVASFREVEVFDIRPINKNIPGVHFKKMDFMNSSIIPSNYCDSLSCLHALEHFGLGRYGDQVDPFGYKKGLENMSIMVKDGGILYLSVPIGMSRVEFNAHRIFSPFEIVKLAKMLRLELESFSWYEPDRAISESKDHQKDMQKIQNYPYALGIFTFKKIGM
jgi:hypothetical protein